jgi:hypothetical protein
VAELSAQIRLDIETAQQVLVEAAQEQVTSCEEQFNT